MKKTIIALLIASTSIFFVACNSNTEDQSKDNDETSNKITLEQAEDIALKDAKLKKDEVNIVKAEEETDDGSKVYNIEFYSEDTEYDYKINADSGKIVESDKDIDGYPVKDDKNTDSKEAKISEKEAKDIALKDAKLTEDKVKFEKVKYDNDNNVNKYDIDFHYNNQEYNYEINAKTGEIISHDIDQQN